MYGNEQLDSQTEVLTVYAFSHIESWLEYFAKSNSIPFEEFAQRVATILYAQAGGEVSRLDDSLPSLRRESTEGDQTTREVEVDERPHREARRTIMCGECNKKFSGQSNWMKHMYKEHPELTDKWAKKRKAAKQDGRGKYTPKKIPCKVCGARIMNHKMGAHVKYEHGSVSLANGTKAKKRKLSPAVLRSLRKTAAHAREVLAARRKNGNGNGVVQEPIHEPAVPAAVTDAMSAYQEAVRTEDKSLVNV